MIYLFISLSINWYIYLPIYLPTYLPTYLIYLQNLFISVSLSLSVSRGAARKLLCVSIEIFIVRAGSLTSRSDTSKISTLIFFPSLAPARYLSVCHSAPYCMLSTVIIKSTQLLGYISTKEMHIDVNLSCHFI